MWGLADSKFAAISLSVSMLLMAGYSGAEYVIPWISSVDKAGEVVKIFSAVVFALLMGGMLAFKFNIVKEWEEEVIDDLTIHQEPAVFRLTALLSFLGLFVLGTLWRLHWPMHVGFISGGTFFLLYIVDIAIEAIFNWDEAMDNILSESEHALRMGGMALLLMLAGGILCVAHYHSLTIPEPLPVPKERGIGDRLQDIYENAKEKLPFSSQSNERREIEKMLEQANDEKFRQWREELQDRYRDAGQRELAKGLPQQREKFVKWLYQQEDNPEMKEFLNDTWEFLRKKKRQVLSQEGK